MNEHEVESGLAETPSYRYADVVGNELFVAGQVPLDRSSELIGLGDPAAQTTQCLDNLGTLVRSQGFTVEDIHHLTIYVVGEHQNLLDAWQAVTDWWDNNVPPATLLGTTVLGYVGQLVEVDARIARVGTSEP